MSSALYSMHEHLKSMPFIESEQAHPITQCYAGSMALYCTESNTMPFLASNTFPEYMYAHEVTEQPKGFWHYVRAGLQEGNMPDMLNAYAQERNLVVQHEEQKKRHAHMMHYLEKEVLSHEISDLNADTLMNHMMALRTAYVGMPSIDVRQHAQIMWHPDIFKHAGKDTIARALTYLRYHGLSRAQSATWKTFWREVRQHGDENATHIAHTLATWDAQQRGQQIRALLDRIFFIVPDPADMPAHLENALQNMRAIPADDGIARAAQLYRGIMKCAPFHGYNHKISFALLNAALVQAHHAPIPFIFESQLSAITPYVSLEFLTSYLRHLCTRIMHDLHDERLDMQYGYTEHALAIIRSFESAQ